MCSGFNRDSDPRNVNTRVAPNSENVIYLTLLTYFQELSQKRATDL